MTTKKRPAGVTFISILQIIEGIFSFTIGLTIKGIDPDRIDNGELILPFLSYASFTYGVIFFICGFGLLSLKKWALILTIIARIFSVPFIVFNYFYSENVGEPRLIGSLVGTLIYILYLSNPNVKQAFDER